MSKQHTLTRWAGLLAASAIIFGACSSRPATTAPSAASSATVDRTVRERRPRRRLPRGFRAVRTRLALLAAAKAEGTLTTIALPHNWCNYGEMHRRASRRKYGIAINELNPDAGSGDEIEAIKANKDNKGPQAPDVIDVGLSFGPPAKTEGLIQPYKVSTWDTIPDAAKDADGYWYGDYYGVLAFEINKAVVKNVPQDWADLLKPEYKGQVALAGDPRTSNQAIQAVYAAALANGGSLDNAQPGLDFFKQLNDAGNFVPVDRQAATVASGETPIRIRWTYNAPRRHRTRSPATRRSRSSSRRPAASAACTSRRSAPYAPHPNAAKLWMEYLYSRRGPEHLAEGLLQPDPLRGHRRAERRSRPTWRQAARTRPGAVFPTLDQLNAATDADHRGLGRTRRRRPSSRPDHRRTRSGP